MGSSCFEKNCGEASWPNMKLIVGLGNPGQKYEGTRHNAGYIVVDEILNSKHETLNRPLAKLRHEADKTLIFKSKNFMNASGEAVKKLVDFYKVDLDDLYIVHDDLDIKLGEYKIQKGIGPKEHKGILSVDQALGTRQYWRVRVGVENRDFGNRISGEDYVLQKFNEDERKILRGVIIKICEEL